MPIYPEFEAIIKNCAKLQIVAFLKTIFPGSVKAGKTFAKFGGSEQKTCVDGLDILGAVQLFTADDRPMPILCCAKQMDGTLTERSSRRKQFDESVKVLKEVFAHPYAGNGAMQGAFTQGLFFFFDMDGNFRLSLVTSEIVNGKQELNNYRRQSFFVSAGARNNTFRTRICKKIGSYEDLKNAFDVEKLSDEFFREYKVFYEDIVQYVTGARYIEVKKNKYERTEMSAPNHDIFDQFVNAYGNDAEKAVRNYVKKLMGRLVFIQFLQKKGWLGISMGTDGWTGGDKDFLQHLFDNVSPEEQNSFVDKVLEEVLFYSFNRKESERKLENSTLKKFKFPFLNCGLFDKDRDDDFDFALPGEVFHNKKFHETERKAPDIKNWTKKRKPYFNDEVCGLFDFFDRFNFTIDENDPTDADVSVDPEMLGKIFENLLEDNKDKGAFYTPKEIVGYMCNESLIAYLESECPALRHSERSEESSIRSLVVDLNADSFNEKERETLDQKLSEVKICDPAIGSGAFPMGLLNLLYKTRLKLGVVQKKSKNPEATLKREIIQQNIYGVDIEKGAVDIAQLRFWLSLVVDEVEPDALPNLEYKIMQGNSLLESFEGIDLSTLAGEGKNRSRGKASDQMSLVFDEKQAMEQIQKDLNSFYKTDDYNVKEHLKKDINLNVKNYIKHIAPEKSKAIDELPLPNDKFFLWHTYFRDVFDRKGKSGFDIVIGNPPYIQLQSDGGSLGYLYANCGFESFAQSGDIYCLFYEQGCNLLTSHGHLCFITSNKWLRAGYGQRVRNFMSGNTNPKILIDFAGVQIFDSASVDTNILLFEKAKNSKHTICAMGGDRTEKCVVNLAEFVSKNKRVCQFTSGDSWIISSIAEQSLMEKLNENCATMKDRGVSINRGVVTGFNEAFYISTSSYEAILKDCLDNEEKKRTEKIIEKAYRGRDLRRFGYEWSDLWLVATFPSRKYDIEQYPALKKFLLSFGKDKLEQSGKKYKDYSARKKTNNEWFETQDSIKYWADFAKPKMLWAETMRIHKGSSERFPRFSYSEESSVTDKTCFIATGNDLKYILGVLNSYVGQFICSKFVSILDNGGYLMQKIYIENIPIKNASSIQQKNIIALVDSILVAKKKDPVADTSKQEAEIDKLVYELYGLTDEEIAIVEGTSATTLATKPEKSSSANRSQSKSFVEETDEEL